MENNLQKTLQNLLIFLDDSSPEQLREELKKGNRPFFQTMKDEVPEHDNPFTKETFDDLLKQNDELAKALQGVINECVHPNIAVRAVMVDLTPIRKILKKNTEFINKIKLPPEEPTKMHMVQDDGKHCPICGVEMDGCHLGSFCSKEKGGCGKWCDGYAHLTKEESEKFKDIILR